MDKSPLRDASDGTVEDKSESREDVKTPPYVTGFDPRAKSWSKQNFETDMKPRIYTWNVGGPGIIGDKGIQKFLSDEDPDIICLNDTHIVQGKAKEQNARDKLMPDKYLQYFNSEKQPDSGTAILTKVKPIEVRFDMKSMGDDQMGSVIMMEFKDFIVVTCNVPKGKQNIDLMEFAASKWVQEFRNYLQALVAKKRKYLILCGDLQAILKVIDSSSQSNQLALTNSVTQGRVDTSLFDCFRHISPKEVSYKYFDFQPKSKSKHRGWRLDYFKLTGSAADDHNILTKLLKTDLPIKMAPTLAIGLAPNSISNSGSDSGSDEALDKIKQKPLPRKRKRIGTIMLTKRKLELKRKCID